MAIDRFNTVNARWTILAPVGLSGGGTLFNQGTLVIEPDPPGTVEINLPITGTTGEFVCGSPARDNAGTVGRFTGPLNVRPAPGDVLQNGTWRVHRLAVLDLGGPPLRRIGRGAKVELAGGTLMPFDPRKNEGRLTLSYSNTSLQAGGDFENALSGKMELKDDAAFRVQGAATNHGSLELTTGASMRVDGAFTQSHTGRLSLGDFCELILPGGGTIGGIMAGSAGTITGDVTLPGQTSPGSSPGRLTITGSAAFTPTTVFDAELAGETAGEFDVLNVTGPAVMNGTLAVILLNGYRPAAADTFTIVQAGAMTGSFGNAPHGQRVATVDGYGSFLVSYSATAVVLSAFEANPAPAPSATPQLPAPQILLPESPEPLLSFQLSGTPGRPYLIESSANLQTWTPFHAATLSSSGTLTAEFPFDAATAPRFFRARAP